MWIIWQRKITKSKKIEHTLGGVNMVYMVPLFSPYLHHFHTVYLLYGIRTDFKLSESFQSNLHCSSRVYTICHPPLPSALLKISLRNWIRRLLWKWTRQGEELLQHSPWGYLSINFFILFVKMKMEILYLSAIFSYRIYSEWISKIMERILGVNICQMFTERGVLCWK